MTQTTLRKIKPDFYRIRPRYEFYTIEAAVDGSAMRSCLYAADGSYITTLAHKAMPERNIYDASGNVDHTEPAPNELIITLPPTPVETYMGAIPRDPLGNVGDGAWYWRSSYDGRRFFCWDTSSNELHSYQHPFPGAGNFPRVATSPPAYLDGYIYFWATEDAFGGTGDWSLFRMDADLTNLLEIGLVAVPLARVPGVNGKSIVLTETASAAVFLTGAVVFPHTPTQYVTVRMPLAGPPGSYANGDKGEGAFRPQSDGNAGGYGLTAHGGSTDGLLEATDATSGAASVTWAQDPGRVGLMAWVDPTTATGMLVELDGSDTLVSVGPLSSPQPDPVTLDVQGSYIAVGAAPYP